MRNSRFRIRGINDDRSECCCCGKQNLKRVVWIEDTETGQINHYGTTCALNPARAFGISKKQIDREIRRFKGEREAAIRSARHDVIIAANKKATATYTGEVKRKRIRWDGEEQDCFIPVDSEDFQRHRRSIVDPAVAEFNAKWA